MLEALGEKGEGLTRTDIRTIVRGVEMEQAKTPNKRVKLEEEVSTADKSSQKRGVMPDLVF